MRSTNEFYRIQGQVLTLFLLCIRNQRQGQTRGDFVEQKSVSALHTETERQSNTILSSKGAGVNVASALYKE